MHVPRDLDALLKSELAAAVRLPDGTAVVRSRQRISLQRMRDQLRQELNDRYTQSYQPYMTVTIWALGYVGIAFGAAERHGKGYAGMLSDPRSGTYDTHPAIYPNPGGVRLRFIP